jgi:glycosyltransferase involved in cell wall biosynthesis
MYQYFCNADIFILPSLTEGLPRVVIEAMSTGLPVIASSVGGVPELVEACALVNPGDTAELEQKILQFMNNSAVLLQRSQFNKQESENYRTAKLQQRRDDFFYKILSG